MTRLFRFTIPKFKTAFELIARGILEGYGRDDIGALVSRVEDALIVPVTRPPVSVASLRLPDPELAVFDLITGKSTIQELVLECVARGVADRDETLRAVYIGLSSRALVSPAWPPSESRPSRPTLPLIE